MRKITITEDNFEKVLTKLQNICNKYKMVEFERVYSSDLTEIKRKSNPIEFERVISKEWIDEDGKYKYKTKKKLFINSNFIKVSKHRFREAFEKDLNSYDAKMYLALKSLIHINFGPLLVQVLHAGDKIQFLPFKGFIIWSDDAVVAADIYPTTVNKYIYFPDFRRKIKDLDQENEKRRKEWEEAMK